MFKKRLSHGCSCSPVLAAKVDHSQNINTQQLFSCWERFQIIIHQTSNGTGDTKIAAAAGSHLSVFYTRKNTSFISHMHDQETSRRKTLRTAKTKTSRINVTERDSRTGGQWDNGTGIYFQCHNHRFLVSFVRVSPLQRLLSFFSEA